MHTLSLYKHMAAFVMAYSFTDEHPQVEGESVTLMVPMADILNHISHHNAHLEFGTEALKMVATCDISRVWFIHSLEGVNPAVIITAATCQGLSHSLFLVHPNAPVAILSSIKSVCV